MSRIKIINTVGARPNFMKIAPIIKVMNKHSAMIQHLLVHTGQHYDEKMSKVFFEDLKISKPDIELGVGSGSHAEQTARIMVEFEKVCQENEPDLVIVVGDVNSTIACSLAAKKLGISIAHIEAGLRSFDMMMPEEINRVLTDRISEFLFVTEQSGVNNLRKEGIPEEKIHFVGNVMIDTLLQNLKVIEENNYHPPPELQNLINGPEKYAVLTLHRPSNVDCKATFTRIWKVISELGRQITIIFPVHPRTKSKMAEYGLCPENVKIIAPIGYMEMLWILRKAEMVFTDSGGLQEETTVLGIPCLTIRENTERPATIEVGTNHLVGTDPFKILTVASGILEGNVKRRLIPPLWDGKTAERIIEVILGEVVRNKSGV